ncbi:MAG: hypothetical protein KBD01_17715 [Acidobacteria bacterium]|nr:hypothetical protein [Acidobacteriota bacterium]
MAAQRDFWDKLAIILQPVGGLLTALAVAIVGFYGSQMLERRQTAETNARLYSELMSRREEAESALRKDMFVSVLQNFIQPGQNPLDGQVLNIELLAYNFHESLNFKPLFMQLARELAGTSDPRRQEYQRRINAVAREITAKQLFALESHGQSFRRTVDFETVRTTPGGEQLEPETVAVDGKTSEVGLRVLAVDDFLQQIKVRLEVKSEGQNDTRATFEVGFFDFPMIDSTRLANGQRCAVTVVAFSEVGADLAGICFPAEYASIKDRPYYDEVIRQLQQASKITR